MTPASVSSHSTIAAVVGAVAADDEPVPLDPGDEAARRGRAQVEDLGDPAHRLGTVATEQEQQAQLAHRQVPGGDPRGLVGDAAKDAEQVGGDGGQSFVGRAPVDREGRSAALGRGRDRRSQKVHSPEDSTL